MFFGRNIPSRSSGRARRGNPGVIREEASPSYETYETASIFGSRRRASLLVKKQKTPPSEDPKHGLPDVLPKYYDGNRLCHHGNKDREEMVGRKGNLISLMDSGNQRSSLFVNTGEGRDPLIRPLVKKTSSFNHTPYKTYTRGSSCNIVGLRPHFSDNLVPFDRIPRLSLAPKERKRESSPQNGAKTCRIIPRLQPVPLLATYDSRDSFSRGLHNPVKEQGEMPPDTEQQSVVGDWMVTKRVCNCDLFGGQTHIHKMDIQKGVGVPCLQKSESLTDSELNIGLSRRKRCSRKWCLCIILALLFVTLALAAIVYFAYHLMGSQVLHERVFKGSFRVETPRWGPQLEDRHSSAYRKIADEYKKRLDITYETSVFKKAFIRSEVVNLEKGTDDSLLVHFNLHTDQHLLQVDEDDLLGVLKLEIRSGKSSAMDGTGVDKVEIRERIPPSALPHLPNSESSKNSNSSGNPSEKEKLATASTTTTPAPRVCTPLNFKFCSSLHHNITTYPNLFGHKNLQDIEEDLIAIREVVDSECHTLAFELLCEALQPDCRKYSQPTPRGTFEDEMVFPCQDFCKDVIAACGKLLPTRLRNFLQCEKFPLLQEGAGCTGKPGCTRELRVLGWPERVCDGVVDCEDMSDEDQCMQCTAEGFRCGSGLGCVAQGSRCDGINDCTNGADEKGCLSLTPTPTDRNTAKGDRWIKYNREGLLRYTEAGQPYRVCVDNINKTLSTPEANQLVHNMAEVTCANFTYGVVDLVEVVTEDVFDHVPGLGYVQIADVFTRNITFHPVNCTRRTVVFISCSELACGMRPLHVPPKEAIVERVVRTSASGDWPWVAALIKDGVHSCDATLIHPSWLITTSLCFQGQGRAMWIARLGTTRISSKAPWVQERLIIGMVKSEEPTSKVVLIKLEENLEMSDYVRPACLGSHHDPTSLTTRRCRALGWGLRRDPLLELTVSVDSLSCDVLDPNTVPGASFCARQISPTDRCLLEEMNGAGLLCEWADRWEVVGIAMGRKGCENGARPRTYENISRETVSWIKKTIAAFKRAS